MGMMMVDDEDDDDDDDYDEDDDVDDDHDDDDDDEVDDDDDDRDDASSYYTGGVGAQMCQSPISYTTLKRSWGGFGLDGPPSRESLGRPKSLVTVPFLKKRTVTAFGAVNYNTKRAA